MINVPDIFESIGKHEDLHTNIDQQNINYFLNTLTNLYEFAVCDPNQIDS